MSGADVVPAAAGVVAGGGWVTLTKVGPVVFVLSGTRGMGVHAGDLVGVALVFAGMVVTARRVRES